MCSIQLKCISDLYCVCHGGDGIVVAGVLSIEGIAGIAHVARLKSRGMGVGVLPLQLGINVVLNSLGQKTPKRTGFGADLYTASVWFDPFQDGKGRHDLKVICA